MAGAIEHYRLAESLLEQHEEVSKQIADLEASREDISYEKIDALYSTREPLLKRAEIHALLATTKYVGLDLQ